MLRAKATLKRDGDIWLWEITKCPFCGKTHTHGGGKIGVQNPDSLLGHRSGHGRCGGYVLERDPEGKHADELVTAG
jgi:ribosomal protein L24E